MTEEQNKKRSEKVNPSSLEVSNDDASWWKNTHEKKHLLDSIYICSLTLKRALVIDSRFQYLLPHSNSRTVYSNYQGHRFFNWFWNLEVCVSTVQYSACLYKLSITWKWFNLKFLFQSSREELGLSQQVQLCSTLLSVVTAILFLCTPIVYGIINNCSSPGPFDVNNLTDVYSRDETNASTEMKSKNSISEIFDMDVSVVNQHLAAKIPIYPKKIN